MFATRRNALSFRLTAGFLPKTMATTRAGEQLPALLDERFRPKLGRVWLMAMTTDPLQCGGKS